VHTKKNQHRYYAIKGLERFLMLTLRRVEVCCSVLQNIAVLCSVLQ
jgi:hypothetical protein